MGKSDWEINDYSTSIKLLIEKMELFKLTIHNHREANHLNFSSSNSPDLSNLSDRNNTRLVL